MSNQNIHCIISTKSQVEAEREYFESNRPNESLVLRFGKALQVNGKTKLVVTDQGFPTSSDYAKQTPVFCSPAPMYLAMQISKHAKEGKALVTINHHHPMIGLSSTDMIDGHMHMLDAGFRHIVTGYYCGDKSAFYQYSDGFKEVPQIVVDTKRLDRQILAYGYEAQMLISSCTVLIVGCGGGGFLLAHNLALKGYRLILVDNDVFTQDSLNRVWVNAELIGVNKAKALKTMLERFTDIEAHGCKVEDLSDDVFKKCDIVAVFTDSITSRLYVNNKAVMFGKPAVFLGSEIKSDSDKKISTMMGTCLVYTDGSACYNCNLHVDPNDLQRETLSPEMWKRFATKYGLSVDSPAVPSLVELNSWVAAVGSDQITRLATNFAPIIQRQYLDMLNGQVIIVKEKVNQECIHCSDVLLSTLNESDEITVNLNAGRDIPEQNELQEGGVDVR